LTRPKLTVLLADDDEVDRISVRRALPKSVTVLEARDARTAEAALREKRVDLVLLDYFLPPDTGPAVLARLLSVQPGVPCIFLSGHGSEEIAVEAMKAGAEDYLPKAAVAEPRRLAQLVERTCAASQLRLQVQREQARFALALEASGAGTWNTEGEPMVVTGAERFRELFQLPEGTRWPLEQWLHCFKPPDAQRLESSLHEGSVLLQAELAGSPGRWVELRARREPGSHHHFGTVLDVSASKAAEARTLAMKDRLMGIASHDLKNPLSAVKMGAGLLAKSERLDEKERRVVAHIAASAERMTRLISQLLDLTRVRLGGGLALERKPVELAPLIHALVEETRLGAGRSIVTDLTEVTVSADPDRLGQVVSNLLNNAAKHGAPEWPITVTLRQRERVVEFEVENHGAIEPGTLESLFEPFVQGQGATREGLGLGLFISREVMHAHGGTLTATSSPGGVTRFVATLP
jgi:phosphoserine phosphatase RsbU/P